MVTDIHFKLNLEETEIVKKLLNFPPDLIPTAKDIKNFLLKKKDLDIRIKNAKARKLEAEATIKEFEVQHIESFEKPPGIQAKEAIKTRVHNETESQNLLQFITIENNISGFKGICDFCKWEIVEPTTEKTQKELSRHLTAIHSKEILKK